MTRILFERIQVERSAEVGRLNREVTAGGYPAWRRLGSQLLRRGAVEEAGGQV